MKELDISKHPCFNKKVKGSCGRVHLPVAPKCNIMCNFCNRKYDCVNESRPGVTSAVLSPVQAVEYLKKVRKKLNGLTVAGIAGPGDPMANAPETLETIARVRKEMPDLLLCLSSNGLRLSENVDQLKKLGLTHATITVNAVDPTIGKNIYSWVRDNKIVYQGLEAATIMWAKQKEAIIKLKEAGMQVKVNSIMVPGVNDSHMLDIARTAGDLNVDLFNIIPVFPNPGTKLQDVIEPDQKTINEARDRARTYVPQMTHCKRCRADAAGLLDNDQSLQMAPILKDCAVKAVSIDDSRPLVAVATREGMLVNQHLGEALEFEIWQKSGNEFQHIETREAPLPGGGPKRWHDLANMFNDCRAVLVSGIGATPREILTKSGLLIVEMDGLIEEGLDSVYNKKDVSKLKPVGKKECCAGGMFGGCG
ncbi:radical SAM protein [Desulfonatronovibrio magnus]|uniref:radical SAM protein n=1 Tax=Desulfonatronovibrio magnus TaxID=698827 RepID=UPI0005EB1C62|nr:radical SAM protein [Desulfonatronovibrio magnus]